MNNKSIFPGEKAMVALKRVQNFISAEEVDPTAVSWDRSEGIIFD